MTVERMMTQEAPDPVVLRELIVGLVLTTRPGWRVWLDDFDRGQGSRGLTLVINRTGPDSYHPKRLISVNHYMIVPAAAYDRRSWQRWLFEQLRLVDLHELMEGFLIDGKRPYPPSHGPGNDPYMVREIGTIEDAQTSFRGVLNEPGIGIGPAGTGELNP